MGNKKKQKLPPALQANADKLKRGEPLHNKRSGSKPRSSSGRKR